MEHAPGTAAWLAGCERERKQLGHRGLVYRPDLTLGVGSEALLSENRRGRHCGMRRCHQCQSRASAHAKSSTVTHMYAPIVDVKVAALLDKAPTPLAAGESIKKPYLQGGR